jgi:hypothetical protein
MKTGLEKDSFILNISAGVAIGIVSAWIAIHILMGLIPMVHQRLIDEWSWGSNQPPKVATSFCIVLAVAMGLLFIPPIRRLLIHHSKKIAFVFVSVAVLCVGVFLRNAYIDYREDISAKEWIAHHPDDYSYDNQKEKIRREVCKEMGSKDDEVSRCAYESLVYDVKQMRPYDNH